MAAPLKSTVRLLRKSFFSVKRLHPLCPHRCQQIRMFNSKELKKFYKNATISQSEGWFEINLDQRKLRTPGGNLFRVPNEALALAVATEWNAQQKFVQRHAMHLTSLCNTALDNPMHKTRDTLIGSIIHFLETDTVSFRIDEPEELCTLQKQEWDPVVDWVEKRYDIEVPYTTGIAASPDLSQHTVDILTRHLESHCDWALFGYSYASDALKSLVLTLALLDKFISVERCVQLSRLEQDFQIQRWGNVEWYHDIDLYDLRSRLSASALFVYWCSETTSIRKKAMLSKPV